MADFNKAFKHIIKAEGGYVNNPADKGGETYLGIARKYHKDSSIWKIIDDIKRNNPNISKAKLTTLIKKHPTVNDIAANIYKTKYWNKIKADDINSQKIAEQMFDMAVNAGITTAIKIMQRITGGFETGIMNDDLIHLINNYGKKYKTRKI